MTRRRWDFEMPGERRDHSRHEQMNVCHRKDWRGRPKLAARLCLTCHLIIKEWRLCGRPTREGRPCMRPATVIKGAPWPSGRHQPARWIGRSVRPAQRRAS